MKKSEESIEIMFTHKDNKQALDEICEMLIWSLNDPELKDNFYVKKSNYNQSDWDTFSPLAKKTLTKQEANKNNFVGLYVPQGIENQCLVLATTYAVKYKLTRYISYITNNCDIELERDVRDAERFKSYLNSKTL